MNKHFCAVFSIVDFGKSQTVADMYNAAKVPVCMATHGQGMADSSIFEYLGFGENKKSIMISIMSVERANYLFSLAEEKLNISKRN